MKEEKEKLNFEDTMQELEAIVKELENGELNLDDSIKKFEYGMELSKNASKYLEEAEKKITILTENAEGKLEEHQF